MSTAWDAVRTKRAVRAFADRPIAQDELDRILAAGRRAHSSKNLQRWAFIVVRDRERLGDAALGPYSATSRARRRPSPSSPPTRRLPGSRSRSCGTSAAPPPR